MTTSQTSNLSPPISDGLNYQVWVVKMNAHLRGLGLWRWVESEWEIQPLGNNPTLNQIRSHEDELAKAPRALSLIHAAVSESIFKRIMTCEIGKEAWDTLKEIYEGNERTKRMRILNLIREFETLTIKEKDTIHEYYDKLMGVVNKIRLMGEDPPDTRIVKKLFVSLHERFEAKLSSLEDSKNINELAFSELINSLRAQDQRRAMRNYKDNKQVMEETLFVKRSKSCGYCKKIGHEEKDCWHENKTQCFKCKKFGNVQKYCRIKKVST